MKYRKFASSLEQKHEKTAQNNFSHALVTDENLKQQIMSSLDESIY